jgi:soluble lytic murein transglycosylase-like protein
MRHARTADRVKAIAAVVGSFALVVSLVTIGWLLVRPDPSPARSAAADPGSGTGTPSVTADPTTPAATPTPTPRKTRKPSPTRRAPTRAIPTRKPPKKDLPPPPPTAKPGCTPKLTGPKAPLPDVRDALVAAGGQEYWRGVQPPADLEGALPTITVPANLMKAVAWQESGWQSTILACDGGIGTMQVMPATAQFVNNRFGTDYNVNTLAGNTALGAAYLEWLTMYFGLYYFGDFDLDAVAPVGAGGADMRLRDVVVSAYNVGPAALERSDGALAIPNRSYVNNVTALMSECVCLTY